MNKLPKSIENKIIVLSTPSPLKNIFREWWEENQKKLREDRDFLPIHSWPEEITHDTRR